jgi:hypothetical protein
MYICVYSVPSWHGVEAQAFNMYVKAKNVRAMSRTVQVDVYSHG